MKPGPKPKGKANRKWSSRLAYAVGLFTADGCLQKDGRHLDFTSTDKVQVETFIKCLNMMAVIGVKRSGAGNLAYRVQFSDVLFYNFLLGIGLSPAKSKTITHVDVPDKYFRDFLRGLFDGDGSSYSYYDPIFKNSFRFYISFASASPAFMQWLLEKIRNVLPVTGYINRSSNSPYLQVKFSKRDAQLLVKFMYWNTRIPRLKRKHLKIQRAARIIQERRSGEIGKHATFRS
jgi:hypothetical protein